MKSPYVPERGNVDVQSIFRSAGIEEVPTREMLTTGGFFEAMFELMSEGELIVAKDTEDSRLSPLQRHGIFYEKIEPLWRRAVADPSDPETKQLQRLARTAGALLAMREIKGEIVVPEKSVIRPVTGIYNRLEINRQAYQILPGDQQRPVSIIDLGAGLAGKRFIDWQLGVMSSRAALQGPVQYMPFNDNPFASEYLNTYGQGVSEMLFGDRNVFMSLVGRLYIDREDGMQHALSETVDNERAHGRISAIVCNGLGDVQAEVLDEALVTSQPLLNDAGTYAVGLSQTERVPGGTTFEMAYERLRALGMRPVEVITIETGEKSLGRAGMSSFAFFVQ